MGEPESVPLPEARRPDIPGGQRLSRALIADVTDGLIPIPALQRRGLTRDSYTRQHLLDTLREF